MEPSGYDRERIETWAADFADTPAFGALAPAEKDAAVQLVAEFLRAACEAEGTGPDEVGEAGFRAAMLDRLPALELPVEVRSRAPEIVALFIEALQAQGRHSGGAAFVRALAPAYLERLRPGGGVRIPPVRRGTAPIGRNDPCPCGSGKKFKKCCGR
ncbi:MAG TPA: SEC-C metal-binding domain-containing protein [Planctomycetota bacterium]|nr:SEC-C metal-binding domain-containing protein [Planctomycetota bacterium]